MVSLQFGLRKPRTEGKNIVIEEIFGQGEKIEVDDDDYENLVYIVNSTEIASARPIVKVTDRAGTADNWFNFTKEYHNFNDNPDICE